VQRQNQRERRSLHLNNDKSVPGLSASALSPGQASPWALWPPYLLRARAEFLTLQVINNFLHFDFYFKDRLSWLPY
jgi:hypothetical protein